MLQQQWKELEDIPRTDGTQMVGVRRCERVEVELQSTWVCPFRTIQINCDGAWIKETGQGGFDWVARDFAGIFGAAGGVGNVACESNLMAEVEAIRAAILGYVERGFDVFQVECIQRFLWICSKGNINIPDRDEAVTPNEKTHTEKSQKHLCGKNSEPFDNSSCNISSLNPKFYYLTINL
ncbi:hypothetical protein DVH24_034478 [Malus domestica]|uniref:Uncharacterized protein n=1 Tax=Malus domestica TaxID=3750 RepID=A0A498IW27_MALDO|nr:hypothetical protein DVH24_034478 [Malus domestica]